MATTAADNPDVPPMPWVVASWLGFPLEHIVEGLRRGSIAPPAGAPPGWLPPGAEALAHDVADGVDDNDEADDAPGDVGPDAVGGDEESAVAPHDAYRGLVQAIDAAVDDATFDALWTASGADDGARAQAVDALLWRTVGEARPDAVDDAPAALAAAIARHGTRGTLVALGDEGSVALAARARTDASALAALESLDAYAFVARDDGATQPAARFDPMTGEALVSDAWIDDRARYAAWRAALARDGAADDDVGASWRFVDRALGDGATLAVGKASDAVNQVVFARDGGDQVEGGAAVDRIYGGDGDDTLEGGTGNDRLDGGRGDDRYVFASGDGVDIVSDLDGAGEIVLDGARLDGSARDGIAYEVREGDDGSATLVITAGEGDAIHVAGWQDGALGVRVDDGLPDAADSAPGPGTPVRVLKPLYTWPDGEAATVTREDGNESGSDYSSPVVATVARVEREPDRAPVDLDAWTRALHASPGNQVPAAIAPPDFDAAAITALDVASAIAGSVGDDDGDGLAPATSAPWSPDDRFPPGLAPPDAPPRPR